MAYAAACGVTLAAADRARSPQLTAAAQLLFAGWIASMAAWRWMEPELRPAVFAGVDVALAGAFFLMSRGRWFPAPLFFLHAMLVVYHGYAHLTGATFPWIAAFANRIFELALAYVFACAIFRLRRLEAREQGARQDR